MSELLTKYGFKIEKGGAICCPFHNEKTPSFKIYKNGTRYHCFGCGESGDVITFVMKYCGIDFKQALARINYDFNLNLQDGKNLTLRENVKHRKEIAKRNELKDRIVRLKEVIDIAYSLLCEAERKRRENIPNLSLIHIFFIFGFQKSHKIQYRLLVVISKLFCFCIECEPYAFEFFVKVNRFRFIFFQVHNKRRRYLECIGKEYKDVSKRQLQGNSF